MYLLSQLRKILLTAFIILLNVNTLYGATSYVEPGNGGGCNGNTPCYATINEAMNVSSSDDEIILMPGKHMGGNGTGGSIIPRRISCAGMDRLTIRGYKTIDDSSDWQPENVVVEFSGDSENYGFGITTRNTNSTCQDWWEQNHGQAADGWKIRGVTFQKAKDYFGVMTGIYVAGQGETSRSNERMNDHGSVNIKVNNCIIRGFDLGIDIAHRAYELVSPAVSARIRNNKFYPGLVRYSVNGGDDNFYPKGHSFGAIRAQVNTKVLINNNVITIETPNGYESLIDYIGSFAPNKPKAALRKAMPYRGVVLEGGEKGSASLANNIIEYHNVGILNNGRKTNSKIGLESYSGINIIQHNYIGIGNGPQTCVNIVGNIIGGASNNGGNEVGIMDVGAFSTIQGNLINVAPTMWDTENVDHIGIFSIDSHYNYNYEHESSVDEFRTDMPEAQDVNSLGGTDEEKNYILVAHNMTGLSFYEYGTIGLAQGEGLAPGQSFSLGLDKNAILANQIFSGFGKEWAAPVEIAVGAAQTYKKIQSAINAAKPGQVVVVKPGNYSGNIVNLLGIHVIAENFRDDEDDFDGDSLIDGSDGFPSAGLGGWNDTIISGSNVRNNKWSDSFEGAIDSWNTHSSLGGSTLWSSNSGELHADSNIDDTGYSILWNTNPNANNARYLNFRFNVQETAPKQNAYAVLRYSDNGGNPNFVYFGVEIQPDTKNYRFVIRKGVNGNIYDSVASPQDCTGVFSEWRNDGYITANAWYTMSLQVVSPGFFVMEVASTQTPSYDWKVVFSHSFSDGKSWSNLTDGAGFMVEGGDTYFDNFNWSAGPLVSGHDLNMTSGFELKDFLHQYGSVGFGSKAVSPLIKANTISLDTTSSVTSLGIGMSTGAKPAIIGNVIKNTYVSIATSGSLSNGYGITNLKEESYGGDGRYTQPYMGGVVPNDIWSAPYIYNNNSSNASSANYRILPYSYGWIEKNHLSHNVGNNINSSLLNMVQGEQKFHGLMQFTFLNNYLFDNKDGNSELFGGQGIWSDNQGSNQTHLEAIFDGNFIHDVGIGFWSRRGGRDFKILNNRIDSNVTGLYLSNNTDGFIINNRIYNNSLYGVFISEELARVTAAYNVFKGNYIGFYPASNTGLLGQNHIVNCDMLNNTFAGAYVGVAGNKYTKNNFANNNIGLYVLDDSWSIVNSNTFLHNAEAGVKIYGDSAIRLRRNTFVSGWNTSSEHGYNPLGFLVVGNEMGAGSNFDATVGNIFFENYMGMSLLDNSTSKQVTDNIVFGWDKEFDIADGKNDGYWYVEEASLSFENYSEQDYPDPMFMDPNHEDPRVDDYRLNPGASYGIYGAVSRSPLLDVEPSHPEQLGGVGIGMRVDPCYVAVCWVGKNGYPDDLGPDGIANTLDDYSDIDDVEEYRMTSGDVFSYPGAGNAQYSDNLLEYNFDLYGFKNDGGVKGKTGIDRYLTKRKYYFKLVDTGTRTINLDNVQIPYYPKTDDGSPISINGTFENGGVPDFTGWVELDGNQKGLGESYIVNTAWNGVKGSFCIGTSGVNGIMANDNEKLNTIVFRSVPFRIDLRRGTKLKFKIGGDGGFIPLASNFRYNTSASKANFLACDINGDGQSDLVNYTLEDNSINYIVGVSLAWWDSSSNNWQNLLDNSYTLLSVLSADINADGKDDIVANVKDIGLYWRDSNTGIWNPILDSSYVVLSTLSADINGDGKDDIVANIESIGLYWRDSDTGTWNPILDSSYIILSTLSADMNGDGKDDIVTNIKDEGLFWRDSNTDTWNPILDSSYTIVSILSADMNGDGKDDIVTNIKGQGLFWRDSNTDTWNPILDNTNIILSTLSADINGDGKDDIVTNIKDDELSWRDSQTSTWTVIPKP